jgi:uncharacterized protein YndB with AHSA1/START domain
MSKLFELRVERHIDAPPSKVWDIMTSRMAEWWCPKPWRTEEIDIEWRPGGRANMVMRGPVGEESPMRAVILEYIAGRRWVSTDAFTEGWVPAGPFMVGWWEVIPDGDGSLYRAGARHWTEEAYAQHKAMGFEQGWGACADQLKALCEDRSVCAPDGAIG